MANSPCVQDAAMGLVMCLYKMERDQISQRPSLVESTEQVTMLFKERMKTMQVPSSDVLTRNIVRQ